MSMEEISIKEIQNNLTNIYLSSSDYERQEMLEFFKPSEGRMLPIDKQAAGIVSIKFKVKL